MLFDLALFLPSTSIVSQLGLNSNTSNTQLLNVGPYAPAGFFGECFAKRDLFFKVYSLLVPLVSVFTSLETGKHRA